MVLPIIALLISIGLIWLGLSRTQDREYKRSRAMSRIAVILIVLAVLTLVGTLFTQFRRAEVEKTPIVMLVIDASMTMNRTDFKPTRLAAAQEAAEAFIEQLPEDFRVGLVTYAIEPALLTAPTTDHEEVLTELQAPPRGNRTVIGEGLSEALDAIEAEWLSGTTDAAMILLSDGLDTPQDSVDPLDAAARGRDLEVPIHTLLLGETGGAEGANAELMSDIASRSGGSAREAGTTQELASLYEGLGNRLATELEVGGSAQQFVIAASIFVAAAFFLILRYVI
ncbi:MAG: VWA domain-containing protein [Actinomycetota bacterium]